MFHVCLIYGALLGADMIETQSPVVEQVAADNGQTRLVVQPYAAPEYSNDAERASPSLAPVRGKTFRTMMIGLGAASTAVALVLWIPIMAVGPSAGLLVLIGAVQALGTLWGQIPWDRLREVYEALRQGYALLRRVDVAGGLQRAQRVDTAAWLTYAVAIIAGINWQETLRHLQGIDVTGWLNTVPSTRVNVDLRDVRVPVSLVQGAAAIAFLTAAVGLVLVAAAALAVTTISPVVFFASSFFADER